MRTVNVHAVIDNAPMNSFFWFVWLVTFLSMFLDGYDQQIFGTTLPTMMKDLHLGPTVMGILGSAALWGAIAGAILFGILTDKMGRRTVLVIAVFFFSVFTAACAWIHTSIGLFAAFRFLAGMGIATMTPTTVAMVSEYTPQAKRRFLLTTDGIGLSIGSFIGPLVGILVIPTLGWRAMFLIAFLGLIIIPFIFRLPETMVLNVKRGKKKTIAAILTKAEPKFVPQEDDEYVVRAAETVKLSPGALFRDGLAWNTIIIWIMFFVNMFVGAAFMVWIPKIINMMGYSLKNSLLLTSLFYSGVCLLTIPAGRMAARMGYKKTLAILYAVTCIFLVILSLRTNVVIFAICLFGFGFAGAIQNLTYPFASANYPLSVRATGAGMGASMTRFGGAVSPIIVGMLVGAGTTPVGIYRFLVIPMAIGFVAATLARRPKFDVQDSMIGKEKVAQKA